MALSGKVQKPEGFLMSNILTPRQIFTCSNIEEFKTIPKTANKIEDEYPDLHLLVAEKLQIK